MSRRREINMSIRWSLWVLVTVATIPAAAAEANFDYCTVCHGANGNGNIAIHAPRIAGLEPWYLKSQIAAFKAGWRGTHAKDGPGNEMRSIALALTDTEINRAIVYVGGFAPKPPAITVTGDARHGKTLYATCAGCHGAAGQGNESLHAPALSMRTDWYLATQLHNYHDGLRGANPNDATGQQMRAIAATLKDDAAVNDVVAYIDTLR
jgi:cytochrome c oxidase subunit 2